MDLKALSAASIGIKPKDDIGIKKNVDTTNASNLIKPEKSPVVKDSIKNIGNSPKGNAELNVGFVDNNHKDMMLVKLNLLSQQKNISKLDSEAAKLINENPNDKNLATKVKFIQGKAYLDKGLFNKSFNNFNYILKNNPNSEQAQIINSSFSKLIKNGQITTDKSLGNKLWSATQVTVNASASTSIQQTLAFTIGGAVAGAVVGKFTGMNVAAAAMAGESIGAMANRASGILNNKEQIAQSFKSGYSNISTAQNVINGIGLAFDVGAFAGSMTYLKDSMRNKAVVFSNINTDRENKLAKSEGAVKKALSSSTSGSPVNEGFRQYSDETNVGKAGKGWVYSITEGIPSPDKLSTVKGTGKVTGAEAFNNKVQNMKMQGSSIEDIVSKVPKEAKLRELQPFGNSQVKEGFEYAWVDKKTNMDYRVRIHGADAGVAKHNPTSTAAQGWIVRVERNPAGQATFPKTEYLTLDGTYHKSTELMSLERNKKDTELALAVLKDYQTEALGSVNMTSSSATVGKSFAASLEQESIQAMKKVELSEMIEHFHHNTHIGVGGGLNKAVVSH